MKRKYLFLFLTWISLSVYAQDGKLRGFVNTENFPEVSFTWHEYNPEPINASSFELREGGKIVDVKVKRLANSAEKSPRTIVILWEDMYCNGTMFDFVSQVLGQFIDSTDLSPKKDRICIAAFNRHDNSNNVLKPITSGFESSRAQLRSDILKYRRCTDTYKELPNQSDVYPAILEALDMLQKRDDEEVKGVFVFSAGRPLESSATNSAVEVQKRAKKLHIPLYMYQYTAAHGKSTVLEGLGKDTYGSSTTFEGNTQKANIKYAATMLGIDLMYLPSHYYGQDYLISYRSNLKHGVKETMLDLKVKTQSYSIVMQPAKHTFGSWCKAYWYVCLLLVLVIIGVILGIVLYVRKQRKIHEADAAVIGKLQDEQAQARQKMQKQLDEQAARIAKYGNPQTNGSPISATSMLEWMQKKNLFPRIQYTDKQNNMHVYEIKKSEMLIGRGSQADLDLDNMTVSRKHAKIRFNGGCFEISDEGSSNGTFVAGKQVKTPTVLNDHDVINLGTALLTFYM